MTAFLPSLLSTFRGAIAALPGRRGHCMRCERTTAWVADSSLSGYRCTACGHDAIEQDA